MNYAEPVVCVFNSIKFARYKVYIVIHIAVF